MTKLNKKGSRQMAIQHWFQYYQMLIVASGEEWLPIV
ncbi:hypothetical protein CYB_0400 [Synechococcus sp. JA-2-3B'a(2-13)]|nr:hypothetical protein CYB_0400 [Synechococcus sp. JA-2-3B'a(2-13)]